MIWCRSMRWLEVILRRGVDSEIARLAIRACAVGVLCLGLGTPLLALPAQAGAVAKGIEERRLETPGAGPEVTDPLIDEIGSGGLRAKWTRIFVDWRAAQPQAPPAQYNEAYFLQLDHVISRFHEQGVRVILTELRVPEWASDSSLWSAPPKGYAKGYQPFYPPAPHHIADFGTLGRELAERFSKYGVLYECWNEPNLYYYLYPQRRSGKPYFGVNTYLNMLKAFSRGVKAGVEAANPGATARVIAGANSPRGGDDALSTSPQRFAGYLKDHGAAKYFDAYSHHPYQTGGSKSLAPDRPPYNPRNSVTLGNLQQLLRLFPNKPFYLTEYAYSTRDVKIGLVGVSEVQQASYLRKALAVAGKYRQVKVLMWYLLKDSGPYYNPSGYTYLYTGLRKFDGTIKLSWYAFAGGNSLSLTAPSRARASKAFAIRGRLANRQGPLAGKRLQLESRLPSRSAWTILKRTSTRADGTYSFASVRQKHTRLYRVKWNGVKLSATRKVRTP